MNVSKTILIDPTKYLTLDFVSYLLKRFLESGREKEARDILLDPRVSVNLYPDLWDVYFEVQIKKEEPLPCLTLIDSI
jgi:hypothetical protein